MFFQNWSPVRKLWYWPMCAHLTIYLLDITSWYIFNPFLPSNTGYSAWNSLVNLLLLHACVSFLQISPTQNKYLIWIYVVLKSWGKVQKNTSPCMISIYSISFIINIWRFWATYSPYSYFSSHTSSPKTWLPQRLLRL